MIDILLVDTRQAQHDSVRFDQLLRLAAEHLDGSPDSARMYCTQARRIAEHTGRAGDPGEVEGWLGYIAEQQGRVAEAVGHYRLSLAEAERLNDTKGISSVLNNLAAIYMEQGHPDSAMQAHERSLRIRRKDDDTLGIATSLNNIGLLLAEQGRVSEAMEHYAEALRLYEAGGDADGTATTLHNLAVVYRDQGDLSLALSYFLRELAINDSLGDGYSMATTEDNIGGVLERGGRIDEAMEHYRKAYLLHARSEDPRGMGYSLRNIAGIEIKRGIGDSALFHATRSLALFDSVGDRRGRTGALLMQGLALELLHDRNTAVLRGTAALADARTLGYPLLIRDAAALLERLYRSQEDWKRALEMKDLYVVMRDSILNDDARRSTIRQQYKYAYEKREAALKAGQTQRDLLAREQLQKEKNRRNILLFSGIGVMALAAGLWSRLRFVRRSRAAVQRERDVADGLLLNILPQEVAAELKLKGEAEARQIDQVTVLFTDFKGFTAMSERVTPRELVHDLHECFSTFDRICEKHGIEKIKTIGDAYMAAGGLPTPTTTHATDVIMAALDMRDFIAEGKGRKVAAGLPYFEIRIGVHTGPVVAGIVGVKKFQYDIWGDTVNTASRMESSGEVGRVNISEATHALVRHVPGLAFVPRGRVPAKGKGEMAMFFVDRGPEGTQAGPSGPGPA